MPTFLRNTVALGDFCAVEPRFPAAQHSWLQETVNTTRRSISFLHDPISHLVAFVPAPVSIP
jgi:hypothetical protein